MADVEVKFRRGTKQEIDAMPIVDGQLVYNTDAGNYYMDAGGKRISEKDYVTPEMFGAKGDGVTDDTVAIQKCFDFAGGIKTVLISAKEYLITKSIIVKDEKMNVLGLSGVYLWNEDKGSRIVCKDCHLFVTPDNDYHILRGSFRGVRVFLSHSNPVYDAFHKFYCDKFLIANSEIIWPRYVIWGGFSRVSKMIACNFLGISGALIKTHDDDDPTRKSGNASDSVITACYINGRGDKNAVTFQTENFVSMMVSNCYIDYFKSIFDGDYLIGAKYDHSHFANCIIEICWRLSIAPTTFGGSYYCTFSNCTFNAFSEVSCKKHFLNPDADMVDDQGIWRKCGLLVTDSKDSVAFKETGHHSISGFNIHDCEITNTDYPIRFRAENTQVIKRIKESGNTFSNCKEISSFIFYANLEEYRDLYFESAQWRKYETLPSFTLKPDGSRGYAACYPGMIIEYKGKPCYIREDGWKDFMGNPADTTAPAPAPTETK